MESLKTKAFYITLSGFIGLVSGIILNSETLGLLSAVCLALGVALGYVCKWKQRKA